MGPHYNLLGTVTFLLTSFPRYINTGRTDFVKNEKRKAKHSLTTERPVGNEFTFPQEIILKFQSVI